MKTCKKLFSLLLVAVMLVAAIPFATMAEPIGEDMTGVTVVAKCNGAEIAKAPYNGTFVAAFDPTVSDHLDTAVGGSYGASAIPGVYTRSDATFDKATKTLTINYTLDPNHAHDWKVVEPGDANGHVAKCQYAGCGEIKVFAHSDSEIDHTDAKVEATCGQAGKEAMTVYKCGFTVGGAVIPATGNHTFENGACKVCGAPDPDYKPAHTHDYKWDGKVGDANGHTLKCDVAGCTETTKTEAHKFDSNGKCTVCGYQKAVTPATPTYTVIVKVEGKKDQTFTKVAYDGTLKADNAQAILNKAGCTDQVSDYNNLSFTNDNGTITISLSGKKNVSNPNKVTVTVVNGSETKTYELEVGKYYYDYDFFTFANQDGRKFAALKITDTAGYERILDKDVKNDSAKVRSNDAKVTVQWNADTRKVEFMTDSTLSKVGTTRDVYYGARLDSVGGTLPTTVGGKTVEYWTVWGSRIYDNTEYKWNADKVQAVPHFAGESGKVYLEIYANGNRTSKYTQIDITYLLQDGVIYRDRLTSAIESAVKTKNVKITGVFEEGDWSAYVRNVNNVTSKTSVQIGTNNADARYLYVMVNGVSTKTGDSTNPKTGDTAKLGVAAAVLAVAVVGFGAVTVINKKKGVQ